MGNVGQTICLHFDKKGGTMLRILINPSESLNILVAILGILNLLIAITCISRMLSIKIKKHLISIDREINSILIICFIIIFFTFLDPIYDVIKFYSPANSWNTDPRVMIQGVIQFLFPMVFSLLISSFFIIVWFLLRAYNKLIIKRELLINIITDEET